MGKRLAVVVGGSVAGLACAHAAAEAGWTAVVLEKAAGPAAGGGTGAGLGLDAQSMETLARWIPGWGLDAATLPLAVDLNRATDCETKTARTLMRDEGFNFRAAHWGELHRRLHEALPPALTVLWGHQFLSFEVLRVLRMERRVRFHRKGELRLHHRHPERVPGARHLPLLRSGRQDPRRVVRVAREQAQLALVHQRSRARAHGELGDDEGERRHAGADAGRGRPRLVAGAGAPDPGDGRAVRERDLRRGPAAAVFVGGRPRGARRRRGTPDHATRAEEHQHVRTRRSRARGVPREVGEDAAAARAGRV